MSPPRDPEEQDFPDKTAGDEILDDRRRHVERLQNRADPKDVAPRPSETEMAYTRDALYREIDFERVCQDDKWGGPSHDDLHFLTDWLAILQTYTGRIAAIETREGWRHFLKSTEVRSALARQGDGTEYYDFMKLKGCVDKLRSQRKQMMKAAAVAVAAMEWFDRRIQEGEDNLAKMKPGPPTPPSSDIEEVLNTPVPTPEEAREAVMSSRGVDPSGPVDMEMLSDAEAAAHRRRYEALMGEWPGTISGRLDCSKPNFSNPPRMTYQQCVEAGLHKEILRGPNSPTPSSPCFNCHELSTNQPGPEPPPSRVGMEDHPPLDMKLDLSGYYDHDRQDTPPEGFPVIAPPEMCGPDIPSPSPTYPVHATDEDSRILS
jgi:hypothetical protein